MERRKFLKVGAGITIGSFVPGAIALNSSTPIYSGWLPNKAATASYLMRTARPYLTQQTSSAFKESGKGKVVHLWKYLDRALGGFVPHHQKIGDCVGQSYALATEILAATQIYHRGYAERWEGKVSTETVYAGSRYEIGYKEYGSTEVLKGDGSFGLWCAEFVRDYGVLMRKQYLNGKYDLSKYDPKLAKAWGRTGVPDELEPTVKKHPVRSIALVKSYKDVRDAIANGYPVVFCSSIGFGKCSKHNVGGRDSQGFLVECGQWYHAMTGVAVDDKADRKGVLIQNSWGTDWVGGPKRHGQPDGSFWVDAATIDKMCQQGDSFAISGFIGFPATQVEYNLR